MPSLLLIYKAITFLSSFEIEGLEHALVELGAHQLFNSRPYVLVHVLNEAVELFLGRGVGGEALCF